MWKCRQKFSSIQRTLLQKYQALLWSNQNDQFFGKKILFEGTYSFWHCASWDFSSHSIANWKPKHSLCFRCFHVFLPAELTLSKVQSICSARLPVSAPTVARLATSLHWFKKNCFFLERIPILRVHLLSLFIGGTFGTPCHAKFHKGTFFVHCKMKWSLFSLLSAQESCLDEVPIPGERTWRRQKETVPLHGFLLSSYCPIYKVDQNNTNNLTSMNNRATAHRYLTEV